MKKLIIVLLILLILVNLGCCAEIKSAFGLGPDPEVVGMDSSGGLSGFDYVVTVDCQVRNNGESGYIKVYATLQNGGYWKKERVVYVASGQTVTLEILFREPRLLDLSSYRYRVWAEPM